MPEVIYRGPSHRFEVDGIILERDGDAVTLTDEQIARAGPGESFSTVSHEGRTKEAGE